MARGIVKGGLNDGGGSNIKSIQRGVNSCTSISQTVTISAIDVTKSIVNISYSCSGNNALRNLLPKVVITNSTTLTITFNISPGYEVYVSWEVIEFNNVKNLQTGLVNMPNATPLTVNISAVNLAKSMLYFTNNSVSATSTANYVTMRGLIATGTTLTFNQGDTISRDIAWQVVEFN